MKILACLALISTFAVVSDNDSDQLSWLVGCWVSPDNSAQEVWVVDSDQSLVGFGIAFNEAKVGFYEVLSIRRNQQGSLVYTAHPSGQPSASFAATTIANNSVVFTNPDHDYPQEINYIRDGNNLYATTSLLGGADLNSFEKSACD